MLLRKNKRRYFVTLYVTKERKGSANNKKWLRCNLKAPLEYHQH